VNRIELKHYYKKERREKREVIVSPYTSVTTWELWRLLAVYADDSDLLHIAEVLTTGDEFLAKIQQATSDWGGLVQATGGSLKSSK